MEAIFTTATISYRILNYIIGTCIMHQPMTVAHVERARLVNGEIIHLLCGLLGCDLLHFASTALRVASFWELNNTRRIKGISVLFITKELDHNVIQV